MKTQMTDTRRGAWIINISKHLQNYDITSPGLSHLENICFAGKCGNLLIKLSADKDEQLKLLRVRAHGNICGITIWPELRVYLETLKTYGCLDWEKDMETFEVLSYSRQRVLITTSNIFFGSLPHPVELALIDLLEYCLVRPRLESEVVDFLSKIQLKPEEVPQLLELVRVFELLGIYSISEKERLFFNSHQFGDKYVDIGKGLSALSSQHRQELNDLIGEVATHPGIPKDSLQQSEKIINFAVGLGLVESNKVSSLAGEAEFLTSPRMAPPSVGRETSRLEDDVFNHAKMLLSSFKFGELKSKASRGRIIDPPVLVSALLERNCVGPCTAIGQDYIILEGEGVIKTTPSKYKPGQFYMELRRREPAEIVLDLLENGLSDTINARSLIKSLELPVSYYGPETIKPVAARKVAAQSPQTMKRFLEELRT